MFLPVSTSYFIETVFNLPDACVSDSSFLVPVILPRVMQSKLFDSFDPNYLIPLIPFDGLYLFDQIDSIFSLLANSRWMLGRHDSLLRQGVPTLENAPFKTKYFVCMFTALAIVITIQLHIGATSPTILSKKYPPFFEPKTHKRL